MIRIFNKSSIRNCLKVLFLFSNLSLILLIFYIGSTSKKYISYIDDDGTTSVNISYLGKGDYSVNELRALMELIAASYNENSKNEEIFYETSSLDIQIPYLSSKSQVKVVSYSEQYVEHLEAIDLIDSSQANILLNSSGAIIPSTLVPYVDEDFFNYVVENSVYQDTEINKNAIKIEGTYLANTQTIMISEDKLIEIAAASGVTPSFDLKVVKPNLNEAIKFEKKFNQFIDMSDYAISVNIEEPLYNDIILVLIKLRRLIIFSLIITNIIFMIAYNYLRTTNKEDFKIMSSLGITQRKIMTIFILNNSCYYLLCLTGSLSFSLLLFRHYCNNFEISTTSTFNKLKNTTLFDSTSESTVNLNLDINGFLIIIFIIISYVLFLIITTMKYKFDVRQNDKTRKV